MRIELGRICLLLCAVASRILPEISIVYPPDSSVILTTDVVVGFDVSVGGNDDLQVCFKLDRVAQRFEYHMCEALTHFYPPETAQQQLVLKDLLPGKRTITLALAMQDGRVLTEVSSSFTVVDPAASSHVDLLSLTSRSSFIDRANVFDEVYRVGFWQLGDANRAAQAPPSGIGSTLSSTALIRRHLQHILTQYKITSILDVPCGDMTWMPHLDFNNITYIGADISSFVVEQNRRMLEIPNSHLAAMLASARSVSFLTLDLVHDAVPEVELIFCRHMMMHLSPEDNLRAIANIQNSSAKYLLATTYLRGSDNDKDYTLLLGHKINLFAPPYCFRDPLMLVKDDSERDSHDMYMGLWELRHGNLRDVMSPWCAEM